MSAHPVDADFGERFIRLVLHRDRVLTSIDRVLGERLEFGPIGAGPGRKLATITVRGRFGSSYGDEVEGADTLTYRVCVPLSVTFDLDLRVDRVTFDADIVAPLLVRVLVEDPVTIIWDITPPSEDDLTITVTSEQRRATVIQKIAGLDVDIRRFVLRVIARELEKPHVQRARRIELATVIDGAWPQIASQFLPNSEADRLV